MSPEQAQGKWSNHRADLWSLGVIAFQCLTGRLPFESAALGELMGLILYEPLPRPTAFNMELPTRFDDWWERAASRDRELRFQSAKEMADELGVLLGVQTAVTVPTVPPRHNSSFPPFNERSGVITAPNTRDVADQNQSPEPRAAQLSAVQVVASGLRTLDEQSPEDAPSVTLSQLTRESMENRLKRLLDFCPKSKWLALAVPVVALLVLLGIALGFMLRGSSANTVAASAASSPSFNSGGKAEGYHARSLGGSSSRAAYR